MNVRPTFRAGLAAVAAATVLVAGAGLAAEAAGKAKPVLAGANNKAQKTTKLSSKKGPALALKSKKGPALSVNSNALIPNLNADMLDGLDSKTLDPNVTEYKLGPNNTTLPASTAQQFQAIQFPAGSYEVGFHGYYSGDDATCLLLDPAILTSPTPDLSRLWLGASNDPLVIIKDANVITLAAPATIDFGCVYGGTNPITVGESLALHVRKVNTLAPGTGTATTIGPKGTGKLNGLTR